MLADRNFGSDGNVRRLLFRQSSTKRCDYVLGNGGFDSGNSGFVTGT